MYIGITVCGPIRVFFELYSDNEINSTESIYKTLNGEREREKVHTCKTPVCRFRSNGSTNSSKL